MSWTIAPIGRGGNLLYSQAGTPSLDLRFAETKSLTDFVSGNNLVTFSRTSGGTYVDSQGVIKTALDNEPRFDHNPSTGESLGLLVEEARTNLVQKSEAFTVGSTGSWNVVGDGLTITANQTTAPDGTNTASLAEAPAGSAAKALQFFVGTATVGQSYTSSIFAKAGTWNYLRIEVQGGGASGWAAFDLVNGTLTNNGNSPDFYGINSIGNGWYRIWVTDTALIATGFAHRFIVCAANGASTPVTTGATVYIWGAQLETGSFPTSYIPTNGAEVTRAADVASISGSNFSSWYNQSEGTVFAEGAVPVGNTSTRALLSLDNGSDNERIQLRHNGTTSRTQLVVDNGSVQFNASLIVGSFPPGEYRKLAMAVKANEFAVVIDDNGTVETGTGTMPTPTQLQIGSTPSDQRPCKPIKRLTYWGQRLPNSVLQAITQ